MEINSTNFKEMASRCGEELLETFRGAFDRLASQEREDVFLQTVELGIENTMRALIEADVEMVQWFRRSARYGGCLGRKLRRGSSG